MAPLVEFDNRVIHVNQKQRTKDLSSERQRKKVVTRNKTKILDTEKIDTVINQPLLPCKAYPMSIKHSPGLKNEFYSERNALQPMLTLAQKEKRLSWAKEFSTKSLTFWSQVLFSDEVTIQVWPSSPKRRVKFPKHRRYNPEYVIGRLKPGARNMRFWGAICYKGAGVLLPIKNIMTNHMYAEILAGVFKSLRKLNTQNYLLQEDAALYHHGKVAKEAKKEMNIELLGWPPNSPDLNPLRKVWTELKNRVKRRKPRTMRSLKRVTLNEWPKIPRTLIRTSINCIPGIINNVVHMKGDVSIL